MSDKVKRLTLLNGAVVIDQRKLMPDSIRIVNAESKNMSIIHYNGQLLINITGKWIDAEDVPAYVKELELVQQSIIQANEFLKQAI